MTRPWILVSGAFALLLLAAGYGFYALFQELESTRAALRDTKEEAARTERALTDALTEKTTESEDLAALLAKEQSRTEEYEDQVDDLEDTVTELEKAVKIDPELLAKYSKVFFLNENYAPVELAPIPSEFGLEEGRTYEFHAEAIHRLEDLLEDAAEDELSLRVASAYRSFGTQASLKSSYTVRYGSGANGFSADQGYSEHQLGTTIDFTTPEVGGSFVGFDQTKEYAWLTERAWRYGFVLSYPKGNRYYQYEPWHWRYVGQDLAEYLHDEGKYFYDLDQRAIDEYLSSLFD